MSIVDIFAIIGVIATVAATVISGFQLWLACRPPNVPTVNDRATLRILRALINEDEGRDLHIYRDSSYYGLILKDLAAEKTYLFERGGKYFLTEIGKKVVKKHLKDFMRQK